MPYFSEETLQAVRAIQLYEIVRTRVELSRSGRNWKGLSPFTPEKTASFFVLTDRNFFKCFSSGLAGDGIKFIQETERLSFPEAVEFLAERFAIPVSYDGGAGPDPEIRSLRQALLDIHDYARDYYHQAFLADHPVAEQVRHYWVEERGFSLDLAKAFQVGFAPPQSSRLLEILLGKGFSKEALAESGLFHTGRHPEDPRSWYFAFRGRLMIPIRNPQGQVVAFTARQLAVTPQDHGSWKAKYINSPETRLFKKGHVLFNLERASEAVAEAGRLLMVEGQLDALRCWECGLQETVATQGTAVTSEQMELIKRYADRLDVLLDRDRAGQRAVLSLLPLAFKHRLEVRVLSLPPGQDPDDFLRRNGAEAVRALPSEPALAFAGKAFLGSDNPTPEARSKALQSLFKLIAECPSAVVREGYFDEAIEVTGVSRQAALEDFRRAAASAEPVTPPEKNRLVRSGTNSSPTLTNLEADLLFSVSQNVAWAEPLAQVIDHQWIRSNTVEGKILSRILAQTEVDCIEKTEDILFLLETDEERDCFSRAVVDERPVLEMLTFVNETLASLLRRFCRDRISQLEQEITRHAHTPDNWNQVLALKKEQQQLRTQLLSGPFPEVSLPA